jgi:hypothetical protein
MITLHIFFPRKFVYRNDYFFKSTFKNYETDKFYYLPNLEKINHAKVI